MMNILWKFYHQQMNKNKIKLNKWKILLMKKWTVAFEKSEQVGEDYVGADSTKKNKKNK